ncbi:hypothetical protein BC830DRAFT_798886 [Chytriomyces sp. MP71]|nr:hypothetical protein BC830DRAFT_798886 [Chytriomyces sp. MP71]
MLVQPNLGAIHALRNNNSQGHSDNQSFNTTRMEEQEPRYLQTPAGMTDARTAPPVTSQAQVGGSARIETALASLAPNAARYVIEQHQFTLQTPLHIAAAYGHLDSCALFLKFRHSHGGTLLHLRDWHGMTALEVAFSYHRYDVVQLLLLAMNALSSDTDSTEISSAFNQLTISPSNMSGLDNLESDFGALQLLHNTES